MEIPKDSGRESNFKAKKEKELSGDDSGERERERDWESPWNGLRRVGEGVKSPGAGLIRILHIRDKQIGEAQQHTVTLASYIYDTPGKGFSREKNWLETWATFLPLSNFLARLVFDLHSFFRTLSSTTLTPSSNNLSPPPPPPHGHGVEYFVGTIT